jgi:hypothetical protein
LAIIEIRNREASGESFPPLCARCGADSERSVRQTFSWMPSWVNLLIFIGLLPWLIVCLVTRKSIRVGMPMCSRHVHHWRNRSLFVWLGLLFWTVLVIVFAVVYQDIPADAVSPIVAACILGALTWLMIALILQTKAIRAAEITSYGAEIANVNKQFAEAWRMRCDAVDDKARRVRKSRRREYEGDYDDDD